MEHHLDWRNEYLTAEDDAYINEMNQRISRLRALHQKAGLRPNSWQWMKRLKEQG